MNFDYSDEQKILKGSARRSLLSTAPWSGSCGAGQSGQELR